MRLQSIFNTFDLDNSGDLDVKELGALMHQLHFDCDEEYLTAIVSKFGHHNEMYQAVAFDEFQEVRKTIHPWLAAHDGLTTQHSLPHQLIE